MRPTRATRELACLALGHDDGDEPACPATDEHLMRALVDEVQRLRVETGAVEETAADLAEQEGALDDAIEQGARQWPTVPRGEVVLGLLHDLGWQLTRRRP